MRVRICGDCEKRLNKQDIFDWCSEFKSEPLKCYKFTPKEEKRKKYEQQKRLKEIERMAENEIETEDEK